MLGRELTAWTVATLGILIGPHPTPLAFGQEAASGRNRTTQAVTSDRTTSSLDGEPLARHLRRGGVADS